MDNARPLADAGTPANVPRLPASLPASEYSASARVWSTHCAFLQGLFPHLSPILSSSAKALRLSPPNSAFIPWLFGRVSLFHLDRCRSGGSWCWCCVGCASLTHALCHRMDKRDQLFQIDLLPMITQQFRPQTVPFCKTKTDFAIWS